MNPAERRGVAASEGTAMGVVFPFFPEPLPTAREAIAPAQIEAEIARFHAALDATAANLVASRDKPGLRPADREIIDALLEVARDPEFVGGAEERIRGGVSAVTGAIESGNALAAQFEALDDPYLKARAEDVHGITRNVAATLLGRREISLADVPPRAILVAEEISAWDFAKAPIKSIAGILCTKGAATSHVAIMARAHGIPAVLGYHHAAAADLKAAKMVAIDGATGEVFLDPDPATAERIADRIAAERKVNEALAAYRDVKPVTRDGREIEVAANLGSLSEIDGALAAGAMGVGLFRTELLFMERKTTPSEDEQTVIYTELARAFAHRPVIVRTLDIGGDKPVAGVEFPHEDNPFLGWRGVRMCLDRPDIFKPQLKALLRAAVVGNVKVMVPMVATVDEVEAVKALVAECRAELSAAGIAFGEFELGIMVETPAAVFAADALAKVVSFFSIGTNDLTQYVMAVDRLNPRVASLNRTEQPAVMAAIAQVCRAAREAGIWVGMCGEAAARPDLIPRFVEMGITELSMSPASIARAKKTVLEI
ncbi:phosphoenolpyruvate--protein phosphotransferase [Segnochrobactrum spirostomi]|uniref:phosphoenolpyruvate--protein phosphotransferase n=1 Tax=Segnochrobactrum spirostomi TaxID=2608987 RepID=UPI0028AC10AD|nr:phosphoenolpyruvate--protein phosphotransferase [Segnochrobactrum spirostomi]